ncbi:MAG: DUF748 domain-containing protein [Gammaproteobacteria bacterium]|jgi:uncharacterized protein involved in outer membrane biogenesis|nr:DUF748 domain-containing protein [Gammaproteobacteria bacterium]
MIPQRYKKPLIIAAATTVVYALLGFFLAPWLIKNTAINTVRDNLGTELKLQKVSVNPFVLSLQIDALALDEPGGDPFLTVERIFINFQLSSLFRWAVTFREVHIDSPKLRLARDGNGDFNFDFFAQQTAESTPTEPAAESGPPRLLIQDFAITESVVDWQDDVPPEPVDTQFGPINIAISELNTLPDRAGLQDVVITTETQGTLSWNGSLELNPLRSEGRAAIKGSHFPLTSAYLKHEVGFDVDEGSVDVELDYRVDTRPDGTLEARVSNFEMSVTDLVVRTFNEALGRTGDDTEVLRLPLVRLWGGEMRWPEKTLSAAGFTLDDGVISLLRGADGTINVQPAEDATGPDEGEPEPGSATPASDPWRVSLAQLVVNRLALNLADQTLEPSANVGWRSLDIDIRDISNEPSAAFPTTIQLEALDGGSISVDGHLAVLPEPSFDFDLAVDALELRAADPYVKSRVDVHLESGALNVDAQLHSSADEPLRVTGDIEIVDFLLTESDQDTRLGSWASLRAENLVYTAAGNALDVSEVRFTKPYGDILIAEDGSINLGRVRKGDEVESEDQPGPEETDADPATEEPGTAVTIGRILVSDAAADFADRSLPLPFDAKIAALNGEISTIATTSSEPSTVKMEGSVDEFGRVQVSGTVTPLDPAANTDIRVAFENVDMPKFSAYSIPFAGQEISSGRLDLDLGYAISEGALVGENRVVLRDFELGDKVEHPGAMSLPLGLAVALLKDPDGRIDLDVPVRGDVNDPEFKYGAVVAKALFNLITKIVTSPFALLGNLVGAEAGELEYLVFEPGRADLSPPEIEKAGKIAEALGLRPQLALQIGGVYAPDNDAAALKAEKVDQVIEDRIAAADDDKAMYADQRREAVEQLVTELLTDADPAAILDEIRTTHTAQGDDGKEQFDALAYTEALRTRLIDAQPLGETELASLGAARAENVRQAVLDSNAELDSRIAVDAPAAVDIDDDERVRMKLTLRGQ